MSKMIMTLVAATLVLALATPVNAIEPGCKPVSRPVCRTAPRPSCYRPSCYRPTCHAPVCSRPAYEPVCEKVYKPVTRVNYKTEVRKYKKPVTDYVPVTVYKPVTRYETVCKKVVKPVCETVYKPFCRTVYKPVCEPCCEPRCEKTCRKVVKRVHCEKEVCHKRVDCEKEVCRKGRHRR